MILPRALFVAIVSLAMAFAPQFGRWPGTTAEGAAVAAANDLGASVGSPGLHVVAQDDDDDDGDDDDNRDIQTGGGRSAEDLGSSDGVVNPGAEDLGVDDDDDDD